MRTLLANSGTPEPLTMGMHAAAAAAAEAVAEADQAARRSDASDASEAFEISSGGADGRLGASE